MCVVELNASLLPCRHRWYHLLRSCSPGTSLSNCTNKLGLEGWEIKCDFCPYCAGWAMESEHRLLGNDRNPPIGGLSRQNSSATTLSTARRESRRGSLARTDSSTSLTMLATSEKNKAMSSRIDAYLTGMPEGFPRTNTDSSKSSPKLAATTRDSRSPSLVSTRSRSSTTGVDAQGTNAGKKSIMSRVKARSKRLSRSFF